MDYNKLKFMSGIEIHQQLETHKLFCDCPSQLRDDLHDISIKRRLRPVPGEEGEIDIAAKYETKKDIEFTYEGYSDSTCAVEFDEEPPHNVNEDALDTVLEICKLLNCEIVDEIQVMRKTVIDGSNTSGFQRTMLVGYNGYLETSYGKVRVDSVCLEEDSARRVGRILKIKGEVEKSKVYRLDRLGIPLVEIATKPDIKNPEHCKETAKKLGMILRSTGKVKRGLGTIRQDVNVSIKNGARVEIKGFQDIKTMPKIVEYEVKRQQKGKVKEEVRNANPDGTTTFMRPMPGAARMYPETDVKPVLITPKRLSKIKCAELIDDKILRYEKLGLSSELARSLVKEGFNLEDYKYNLDNKLITNVLVEIPKDVKKRHKITYSFKDKEFRFILEALESNKITKDSVENIFVDIANGKEINLAEYSPIDSLKLEKEIEKIVKQNENSPMGTLMGLVMKKFGGKVDGKLAAQLVAKYIK
jgi:Glu-tRNA(Gln) amidotransferase subunit E-like FAD-binding protein